MTAATETRDIDRFIRERQIYMDGDALRLFLGETGYDELLEDIERL